MAEKTMNILLRTSAPPPTGPFSVCLSYTSAHLSSSTASFLFSLLHRTMCHARQNRQASPFESVLLDHRANKHPCQEKVIWAPFSR